MYALLAGVLARLSAYADDAEDSERDGGDNEGVRDGSRLCDDIERMLTGTCRMSHVEADAMDAGLSYTLRDAGTARL